MFSLTLLEIYMIFCFLLMSIQTTLLIFMIRRINKIEHFYQDFSNKKEQNIQQYNPYFNLK